MLGDQFKYLAWFYMNPRKAASAVLDHGQFLFAVIAASLVTLVIGFSADRVKSQDYGQVLQSAHLGAGATEDVVLDAYRAGAKRVESRYFATSLKSVVVMAVVFTPVCVLLLAAMGHLGGGMTVFFRDYMPVLAGLLFAWAAAHLPLAGVWYAGMVTSDTAVVAQGLGVAYFLVLAAFVLSTVMGVGLALAAGGAVAGLAASIAAALFLANTGGMLYFLASPWVLYFAYRTFGSDISSIGGGLAARQNFKRQLEAATLNPRDADAHYQLGLVYVQRRALSDAEASFRRALEIDSNEPDALFQLGRLLRQSGRDGEARELLERGARIDPKLASHQVWRELGAVALATSATAEALKHLEYYVNIREYDPEGLLLYGRALRASRRPDEARSAFERAIEAVRTAPKFRRSELGPWERQARQELKG
jgi:hypothetical protein